MEMTRNIPEDKNHLRSFCDKIRFNQKLSQQKDPHAPIPSVSEYIDKLDPRVIYSVKKIDEKFGNNEKLELDKWFEDF